MKSQKAHACTSLSWSRILPLKVLTKKVYKNKNNFHYVSPICTEAFHEWTGTKFGIAVGVADIIM